MQPPIMNDELYETKKTYDDIAEDYASRHNQNSIHLDRFLELIKGKRILDAGCGPGNDTKRMVETGHEVACIDFSSQFVRISRKKVRGAQIRVMDMRHLTFPDESFDGIWANASFHHIPKSDGLAVLQGFKRVL